MRTLKKPAVIPHDPDKAINSHKSRTEIEKLSIDYSIPMPLACCLVGRTEKQTTENIQMMIDYIEFVVKNAQEK